MHTLNICLGFGGAPYPLGPFIPPLGAGRTKYFSRNLKNSLWQHEGDVLECYQNNPWGTSLYNVWGCHSTDTQGCHAGMSQQGGGGVQL